MSGAQTQTAAAAGATETKQSSFLDQVFAATQHIPQDAALDLVTILAQQAAASTVTFHPNISRAVKAAIAGIDAKLSAQVSEILHDPKFSKLEGSWRGLQHLVRESGVNQQLKIKVINMTKREMYRDLTRDDYDQSAMFKKIYEQEIGTPGGEPYGLLIGDYEWTSHPEDIESLRAISGVAAASFAPFISGVGTEMFGVSNWKELDKIPDLTRTFDSAEYTKWRGFRESEDARFVSLVMPRTLARQPYGAKTRTIDEFRFEETKLNDAGLSEGMPHEHYCWSNAAYAMGVSMTYAFGSTGFCTAICGESTGGKVDNLQAHQFRSQHGDEDQTGPTEFPIEDRRWGELASLGFTSLVAHKNKDFAVFYDAPTVQKAKTYGANTDATANAAISASLPMIMASSRFAHYLKVMARGQIGSFTQATKLQQELQSWITSNYTSMKPNDPKYPLKSAKVEVKEVPGRPGAYNAVALLEPWVPMKEFAASIRMVARIDKK
jgi:type VI secretion system protein ImpC